MPPPPDYGNYDASSYRSFRINVQQVLRHVVLARVSDSVANDWRQNRPTAYPKPQHSVSSLLAEV